MRTPLHTATVTALMVAVTGCAAAGTGSGSDQSVITRAEIAEVNQMTALQVVRSERPHWLRNRGSTSFSDDPVIAVYLDGVRVGSTEMLADIAAINVQEIRYYDARQAQFRFGVGHVQGAIEVITRRN